MQFLLIRQNHLALKFTLCGLRLHGQRRSSTRGMRVRRTKLYRRSMHLVPSRLPVSPCRSRCDDTFETRENCSCNSILSTLDDVCAPFVARYTLAAAGPSIFECAPHARGAKRQEQTISWFVLSWMCMVQPGRPLCQVISYVMEELVTPV